MRAVLVIALVLGLAACAATQQEEPAHSQAGGVSGPNVDGEHAGRGTNTY